MEIQLKERKSKKKKREREKVMDLGLVLSCRPRIFLYFANRLAASLLLVWCCWSNERLLG